MGILRKRKDKRIHKKISGSYTFWDGLLDILFFIPELMILPIRIVWFIIRIVGRSFSHFSDIT
ncbi:hypothetical protein IM538_09300 [Cytobacillus suaedae]|nr:hypothetical protein IM538_09300 [Cytobacillus suaedae]